MQPLFHFKLNEETGEVIKREITNYKGDIWNYKNMYWRYRHNGVWYYCYESDLDRFKNGHVYSFNDDIRHARSIILQDVKLRRAKAHREYEKWDGIFEKMKEFY